MGVRFGGELGGEDGTVSSGDDCAEGNRGGGGDNGGSESGDNDEMVDRGREDSLAEEVEGPAPDTELLWPEETLFLCCEAGLLLDGRVRVREGVSLVVERT